MARLTPSGDSSPSRLFSARRFNWSLLGQLYPRPDNRTKFGALIRQGQRGGPDRQARTDGTGMGEARVRAVRRRRLV